MYDFRDVLFEEMCILLFEAKLSELILSCAKQHQDRIDVFWAL